MGRLKLDVPVAQRLVPLTFALVVLLGVASCVEPGAVTDPQRATAGTAEAEVRAALKELAAEVARGDLDAIVDHFADDYVSRETSGKNGVREWWSRVIDSGLAEQLTLDLDTATFHVEVDRADVTYYDERGELACADLAEPCTTPQPYMDFRLELRDTTWLITGIPSESQ